MFRRKKKGIKYNTVLCIESGRGFEKDCIYAQLGSQNGLTVYREDEQGYVHELLLHCFGSIDGKENYMAPSDGSDTPKFI